MTSMLADAIDIPVVLVAGAIVLVPLLAFNVYVEALVLKKCWRVSYRQLCRFTLAANIWSLLAGIPTKILNSCLYDHYLPKDIPGYFAWYPWALTVGSLIYFGVTLLVEGGYALHWSRRHKLNLNTGIIWRGILFANLATYVVLAPLHYWMTRPGIAIKQFTQDTRWAAHPDQLFLFVDGTDRFLKAARLDGSELKTIVPVPMTDYLVSADLNACLFRGNNGQLYFYRQDIGRAQSVWKTSEHYLMNQVAFSPSGTYVAHLCQESNCLTVANMTTGKTMSLSGNQNIQRGRIEHPSVTWSTNETTFFVKGLGTDPADTTITISNDGTLHASDGMIDASAILLCYGRAGENSWWSGDDWGVSFFRDANQNLTALTWPGLDSRLRIYQNTNSTNKDVLTVSIQPGLLHLAGFYFEDVAFTGTPDQCVFAANDYLYLLDIPGRRLGTLAKGNRFILLTPRYEKRL